MTGLFTVSTLKSLECWYETAVAPKQFQIDAIFMGEDDFSNRPFWPDLSE